jgi:hypothetical protein
MKAIASEEYGMGQHEAQWHAYRIEVSSSCLFNRRYGLDSISGDY